MGERPAVGDLDDTGLVVLEVRHTDFRPKGKCSVSGHHCMRIETYTAGGSTMIELASVPRCNTMHRVGGPEIHRAIGAMMTVTELSRVMVMEFTTLVLGCSLYFDRAMMRSGRAYFLGEGRRNVRPQGDKTGDPEKDRSYGDT